MWRKCRSWSNLRADLEQQPNGVLVRSRVDDLDALARYLVSLGCAFQIHQPTELRVALQRLAAEIVQVADEG